MKKKLQIIYTSDVHGHIFPVNYAAGKPENSGLLNMAAQIEKDGNTLILDGGDSLQGTPLTSYYLEHSGEYPFHPAAESFNALGCDYFTLGNHDFNFGYDTIRDYLEAMDAVCLCANLVDLRGELKLSSCAVHETDGGLRIGITGIVTDHVNVWEQPQNLTELRITDPFEAAAAAYNQLKASCDICVCIYHGGFEEDLDTGVLLSDSSENIACRLARELDFDLLLTGHQHMPVEGKWLYRTYAVQPPANAGQYIHIDLEYDGDTESKAVTSALMNTGDTHSEEPYRRLLPLEQAAERWLDSPIGRLLSPILPEAKLTAALYGSRVADLFNQVQLEETGADFSCTSLGNDAVGLTSDVTMREICGAYLFANTLVMLEVDREVLLSSLERCASYFTLTDGGPQVSEGFLKPKVEHYNYDFYAGLHYEFDLTKPVGHRVVCLTRLDGSPLTDGKYRLVTSNYRATGTGGYDAIRTCPVLWRGATEMPELVAKYVKKNSPIPVLHNSEMLVTWNVSGRRPEENSEQPMNRFDYGEIWVRNAGDLLRSLLDTAPISFTEKSGHSDIVTACDKELEQYLRSEIQKVFPEDQIIGEEFPATGTGTAGCTWYLDPIDGTTNFVNQRSNFAISVGCTVPGGADFGFVLDVERQQLYSAETGRGAWLNGRQLHTSETAAIKDSLLTYPSVTDVFLHVNPCQAGLTRLSLEVRAVRSLGSVALELCEVASGKMDLCIAIKSCPWDHNAARVILTEAGGTILALDGSPLSHTASGSFLAGCSAELVGQVIERYIRQ